MTATSQNPPVPSPSLPPLASTLAQSVGQHAGTAIAGALIAYGLLPDGKASEVTDVAAALALGAASLAWTGFMHWIHARKAVAVAQVAAVSGKAP